MLVSDSRARRASRENKAKTCKKDASASDDSRFSNEINHPTLLPPPWCEAVIPPPPPKVPGFT